MKRYLGNCSNVIDWKSVLDRAEEIGGTIRTMKQVWADHNSRLDLNKNDKYSKIYKTIVDNYGDSLDSVEWIIFSERDHYDYSVVEKFSEYINAVPIETWISKVRPGKMLPPHTDDVNVDNVVNNYPHVKPHQIVRCHCHLSDPSIGAVFMVENDVYYSECKFGDIYQWDDIRDVHTGSNSGYTSKYNFHYIGYRKED